MLANRSLRVALLGTCALLPFRLPVSAQETGRIVGRVIDAEDGESLRSAQVFLGDDSIGGTTDLNGRYRLEGVPAGQHTVVVQTLGYQRKSVTGVRVTAGEATKLDITMTQQAVQIEGLTVSAEAEEKSAAVLLDQRRTAASLTDAVGAQEISRRPDSDAAEVAQRMAGVTVTDGKYVFVRGLGGRYSQTSLNGASLPSPEPEKEVVPLDLFPSDFLESLETQKSYTPDLPADFSGGSVRINTRDFPSRFTIRAGVSTSFNTDSQFQDGFLEYGGGGRDWLGLDDGTRAQPEAVERIMGGLRSGRRLPTNDAELIEIGEALRSLDAHFAPASGDTPLNRSFDLSIGGSTPITDDGELGYFFAGTYSDSYTRRDDEIERKWRTSAFRDETADIATPNVDYRFLQGTRSVGWGTIGNVTFKPSRSQKISLRTTVNLDTDDEARTFTGLNDEDIGGTIFSERARFVERLMLWGQLSGEHQAFLDSRLDWRLTAARASRDEPLLRETIYLQDPVSEDFFLLDFSQSGRYFFSTLTDDDLNGSLDWEVPFELLGREASVKVGGAHRDRRREFGSRRLNWEFLGSTIRDLDEALEGGTIVASAPSTPDEFLVDDIIEPGDVYEADDERFAGYLMFELPISRSLLAILGARIEKYTLDLRSRGESLREVDQTDVAPSLNVVYSVDDDLKLRAAASRTVDRPEFRELAPFQFTEAASLRQLVGNPDLESAQVTSFDLRLDWFPRIGELLSVGGFYKDIQEPIEQVFIAAASSAYSFQNAEEATITGVEVDVQLGGDRLADALEDVGFHGNYAWIDSEVRVRPGGVFIPTELERPLEGQAGYVLNLGISYQPTPGVQTGLFFNRFGERVEAAGGSGLPDIYEQPRNSLDATVGFPLLRGARASVKATNLLDADYHWEQSDNGIARVQRLYTVGRTFSVGISWELR